jgi:nucleoside-diphosphate-sugar epimerase
VNELVEMLAALAGSDLAPVYAPARPGEERRSSLAIGRAKAKLGWTPKVPLAKGLAKTVAWQRAVLGGGSWRG